MRKLEIRDKSKAIEVLGEKDFNIFNDLLNKLNNSTFNIDDAERFFRYSVFLATKEVFIIEEKGE